jgi:lysozyme
VASGLAGVDLASFQGTPAQWKAAAGNISWAAVKLTELQPGGRVYVNPDAAADWAYLGQQGLGRVAYLFGHPSQGPAASAAFFSSELGKLGLADGDAIALDLEVTDGFGPAAVSVWAGAVMAILESHFGRPPLLYTFRSFAAEGNCAGLGGYPLWISDPDHPAGRPTVPAPWKTYAIHQYGITGAIDRDFAAYPTLAAMRAALGRIPPPKPKPVPAAEADMIIIRVNQTTVPQGTDWPGVFLVGGGVFHHVTTTDAQAAYQSAGIKGPVVVDYAEYLEWAAGK